MTEPPEPRRPEGGGGEEDWQQMERDAIRDFVADSTPDMQDAIDQARESMGAQAFDDAVAEVVRRANAPRDEGEDDDYLGEIDDDMLLDNGGDEDTELGDMLGAWRDDVDSEPVPPIAERAQEIHQLNQQFAEPAAPSDARETDERNTEPVSQLSELAAQVASHADMTPLINALAEVEQAFQAKKAALMGLLEDTGHSGAVVQAIAQVQEGLAGLLPQINQAGEVITGAAQALQGGS